MACAGRHSDESLVALAGFTLMSYVRGRKLDLAAERLRNSNDKITEIAFDYGFESLDVFGRAFKRV
ncbi:helix-turn-helix domain-containing protein [Paenibacillus sp. Dod16]|uniref:helix-turn-helix domain-containing protein n=1 Tax=Paenibacillus sp. Dod16 TaxID=3416392 RepID=UPI003CEEC5ED